MYRDIHFRVWLKLEEKMAKVEELVWGDDGESRWVKVGTSLMDATRVVLMEYTGKKDVHEQMIFEGDLVKLKGNAHYQVIYDTKWLGWQPWRSFIQDEEMWNSDNIEIIGNVYENPELIKNGKTL